MPKMARFAPAGPLATREQRAAAAARLYDEVMARSEDRPDVVCRCGGFVAGAQHNVMRTDGCPICTNAQDFFFRCDLGERYTRWLDTITRRRGGRVFANEVYALVKAQVKAQGVAYCNEQLVCGLVNWDYERRM